MKLFNKTIDRELFKQYALGSDLAKQNVVVKIFNPVANGTWFILNSDPEDPDYLWAIVDLGYGAEVGSVSRNDLESYRGRFGLGFERDLSFDPINAEELYNGLSEGKFYANGGNVERNISGLNSLGEKVKDDKGLFYWKSNEDGKIRITSGNGSVYFLEFDTLPEAEAYVKKVNAHTPNFFSSTYAKGGGVDDFSDLYGQEVMALKNAKNQAKKTGYDYLVYVNKEGEISLARKNEFERFFDKDECKILYTIDEKGNANKMKSYADGGDIEVVYERRADFKKKPIKLLLLNKGREQKGYTFSGKDQVAVLDNYNRNKQEDLEKLWNLKGYETKYADGGSLGNYDVVIDGDWDEPKKFKTFSLAKKWIYQNAKNYESLELVDPYGDTIFVEGNSTKEDLDWLFSNDEVSAFAKGGNIADFSDNQRMIMNQNVEVEHHHEELEDILEDKVEIPAWVVAKMETATQNLSDITHYLDGKKELMEEQNEEDEEDEEDEEENEEEGEDQEGIKNQNVVEPINVSAGTKAELTKKFTDDAFGNLKGFLKGMEGVDLRDDYTFDYKDEQYEVEPIINSDENGVSNAVFTVFDGDGEEVGEVSYSRDGGKQKFTANSEFFSWNNAKFEDGGYFDGTIPKVSTYMSNYAKGGEIDSFIPNVGTIDRSRGILKSMLIKNADVKSILSDKEFEFLKNENTDVIGVSGKPFNTIVTDGNKEIEFDLKKNVVVKHLTEARDKIKSHYSTNYAKGGGIENDGYNLKDINGKKINVGDTVRTTQPSGGLMNPANPEIGIVEKTKDAFGNDALQIKYRKQGANYDQFILLNGKINEIVDKSSSSFEQGGFMNGVYADGGEVTNEEYEKRLQYLKMMKNNERTDLGKYKIDKEIREINTILEHRGNLKNSYAKGGTTDKLLVNKSSILSATKKCTDGGSNRSTCQSGNFEVTMVYDYGDLDLDFVYLDYNNPRFNPSKDHYASYNFVKGGKGVLTDFDQTVYTKQGRRTDAKIIVSKTIEVLKSLGYPVDSVVDSSGEEMEDVKFADGGSTKEYADKKYILKADIKTVTVKRNGKEVTYKGADVLNGANMLSKGGDLTSKANYVAKRDVVSVELKDGTAIKPVNGYWIKKGAEPIGTEPTPNTSGKSEPKVGETYIRKDARGNWRAETNVENFNGYDWRISTVKTYSGNLVSSAQGGKTEATGTKGIVIFKYTMYQDPNHTLEVSKPSRLTDKVVSEQHTKGLAKFKKFMETGMFKGGGKISNFDKLSAKVAKEYEGKPVKNQYQEEYGKYYSREEAQEVGDKVAGKVKAMQTDSKAFGGLFKNVKNLAKPKPKYPNLEGKQVPLKSGDFVMVFTQDENTLSVINVGKIGSGIKPRNIDISEVDMTNFKAGGQTGTKKMNSGTETLKRANDLAKKIRMEGESWLDAKKRAFAELRNENKA